MFFFCPDCIGSCNDNQTVIVKMLSKYRISDYFIEMYRLGAFCCIFSHDSSYTHLKDII